jgi:hypothetical protein
MFPQKSAAGFTLLHQADFSKKIFVTGPSALCHAMRLLNAEIT